MRIIAGIYKSRKLSEPKGKQIRPTSDRARESLFNILSHLPGLNLDEAHVVDLFAGTGALGLEALSRGARFCLFVEQHRAGVELIKENIKTLKCEDETHILQRDACHLNSWAQNAHLLNDQQPNLIFADPPYGKGLGETAFINLAENNWLQKNAILVLEEDKDHEIKLPDRFNLIKQKQTARSGFWIYRYKE